MTEAWNNNKQQFTQSVLEAALQHHGQKPIASLISEVANEVNVFANGALQSDDITMVALRQHFSTPVVS